MSEAKKGKYYFDIKIGISLIRMETELILMSKIIWRILFQICQLFSVN